MCLYACAGGTFALYSLICRYAKVNKLPNQQPADEQISSFRLKLPTPELERALGIKEALETKGYLKTLLLLLVLMGTSMIIGDGILTPAMSGESDLYSICCNRVWFPKDLDSYSVTFESFTVDISQTKKWLRSRLRFDLPYYCYAVMSAMSGLQGEVEGFGTSG